MRIVLKILNKCGFRISCTFIATLGVLFNHVAAEAMQVEREETD
jgi:hypothetical protein